MALPLRRILATLFFFCIGSACDAIQTDNSFEGDRLAFVEVSGSSQFLAVNTIIKTECSDCHAAFVSYDEATWISQGYVVAGSPESSTLYTKLRGTEFSGDKNMPPTKTLSNTDIDAFYFWIQDL